MVKVKNGGEADSDDDSTSGDDDYSDIESSLDEDDTSLPAEITNMLAYIDSFQEIEGKPAPQQLLRTAERIRADIAAKLTKTQLMANCKRYESDVGREMIIVYCNTAIERDDLDVAHRLKSMCEDFETVYGGDDTKFQHDVGPLLAYVRKVNQRAEDIANGGEVEDLYKDWNRKESNPRQYPDGIKPWSRPTCSLWTLLAEREVVEPSNKIIVFGSERCGKSTLVSQLAAFHNNSVSDLQIDQQPQPKMMLKVYVHLLNNINYYI